jgi:hypothetical protein
MNCNKKPHPKLQYKKQKHMPGKTVVPFSFVKMQVSEIREGARKAAGRAITARAHFNEAINRMRVGVKKIGIAQHYSYQY